jgi:hypothetical protein
MAIRPKTKPLTMNLLVFTSKIFIHILLTKNPGIILNARHIFASPYADYGA